MHGYVCQRCGQSKVCTIKGCRGDCVAWCQACIRRHGKNPRLSLRAFVKLNREELSKAIVRVVPNIKQPISLSELELWVANDEGLYNWARSEGVRI